MMVGQRLEMRPGLFWKWNCCIGINQVENSLSYLTDLRQHVCHSTPDHDASDKTKCGPDYNTGDEIAILPDSKPKCNGCPGIEQFTTPLLTIRSGKIADEKK